VTATRPVGPTASIAALERRAALIRALRDFFHREGFLEVETPVRIPVPIPEAHIDPVASEGWYLQTSPEICMKQLMAAGHDRIFQICKCFRKGERGRRHLPEMTMLEWYARGTDYMGLMAWTERLLRQAATDVLGQPRLIWQGHEVPLDGPWDRLTVAEAFERHASLSMEAALETDRFDEAIALEIEPRLGLERPLFLYDYPLEHGALARPRPDDPAIAERFELYIAGLELCNGFSELNDAAEQRRRFEEERGLRRKRGLAPGALPEGFLTSIEQLPACAGNALGVDRLAMLFADKAEIGAAVAFTPDRLAESDGG